MRLVSQTKKTPEVERAASKDAVRPVLSHVYLNAENGTLEATDSYRAVVIPVEVEDGDTSALIPAEALKAQRKASKTAPASLSVNGDVSLSTPDGEQSWKTGEGQFPNLQQLGPAEVSTFRIGLNPVLLAETAKALGNGEHVTLEFTLQPGKVEGDDTGTYPHPLRPIRLTVPNGGESYGILMPIRIP
jgi:DNA polymerase III sliding clamp (beta) subunit (PCNA family)